ncbi:MAG: heme-binding domain-containing protein [Rikenellaceae bacterium]
MNKTTRKSYLLLSVTVMLITTSSLVLSTAKPVNKKSSQTSVTNSIPDDLKVIFKNSCMACHSIDGSGIAKAKLNFSNWDSYSPGKQDKKAAVICNVVSKGTMPPKSFRKSHPETILTEQQKEAICKWSASFR